MSRISYPTTTTTTCTTLASTLISSSQKPLYLLSFSNQLYTARATNLSVTILTESSVTVTTHLTQGNANLPSTTVTIPGGFTGIITIPPLDGDSLSPSGLVRLTVSGYQGEQLIFSNSTWLTVSRRNVSSSVQTDRVRYRPGQTVQIRIASLQLDNRPYRGPMEISVLDSGGNITQRWDSQGSYLGIVSKEFLLSQSSALGQWAVVTTTNGLTSKKEFMVENSDPPMFDLLLKTAPEILVGEDISGTVRTKTLRGKIIFGTLSVNVTCMSPSTAPEQQFLIINKEIRGTAQFFFSKSSLASLYEHGDEDITLNITASVTETSTGFTVKRVVAVRALQNTFKLQFRDFPQVLKPSLSFFAKLEISRFDRMSLSPPVLLNSVSVVVVQKTSHADDQTETTTLPVVGGGFALIRFTLQAHIQELIINATFMSSKKTLNLFSKFPSASDSYVQIEPSSFLPAQIGSSHELNMEATFQLAELHYVVSARGQVFTAGTLVASSSLLLTPMMPWFPEVCVTVYCVLPDGEVISDTLLVPIQPPNHVSLKWNEDFLRPGDQVSLTVTVQAPRSQVLILVTGGTPEAQLPLGDWLSNRDTVVHVHSSFTLCCIITTSLHHRGKPFQRVEQWSHWTDQGSPVTWLYLSTNVSDTTWVSPSFTVPDSIHSWRAEALVMSDDLGLGFSRSLTATPPRLKVSQGDLTLFMDFPERVIRGEEIVLEIYVINHLQWDTEVILLVEHNEAFEFVLAVDADLSVANARKVTVGSQSSVSALFPIRPLALGEMEISAAVLSAESSESLVQTVLVKPEGVARSFSQTLFLELAPDTNSNSRTISFSFPPDVVPGSQRVHVAVVGDILALSIGGLESLVSLPRGCGEQNLVSFAPSVSILKYLEFLDNAQIRTRALTILEEGYQKELSYQRDDGSFSAFGVRDSSGSTWLTAFVLRTLLRAQPYMLVNQGVVSQAASWLVTNQGPGGDFAEAGRVIHTEMRRCQDNCPAALTAFVVMALLEYQTYAAVYESNVARAVAYLESVVLSTTGNYTLCLMAYALALDNRPAAGSVLAELSRRANFQDGDRWRSSDEPRAEGEWQARSAEVEMVSYVLLALSRVGSVVEGFPLMRWLSQQRNPLGGYGSTQDTVVAIQALADYAAIIEAHAINLSVQLSASSMMGVSHFIINSTNYQLYHSKEINADQNVSIDLYMEGRGFAHFQMNVLYNVESARYSTEMLPVGVEAFSLDVEVLDDQGDPDHMVLSICTGLLRMDGVNQTGMVIVDMGLLSGFILVPEAAAPVDPIRKVETAPGRVILYLDSLTLVKVCIGVPLLRRHKVARVQNATVHVYDYYEPGRGAMRTYNSELMKAMDSCSFCGSDCSRCRAGISLVSSSTTFLHSFSSATYSLGCSFAIMTLLFVKT
ncbi:unnamed protein product [Lota lota]